MNEVRGGVPSGFHVKTTDLNFPASSFFNVKRKEKNTYTVWVHALKDMCLKLFKIEIGSI